MAHVSRSIDYILFFAASPLETHNYRPQQEFSDSPHKAANLKIPPRCLRCTTDLPCSASRTRSGSMHASGHPPRHVRSRSDLVLHYSIMTLTSANVYIKHTSPRFPDCSSYCTVCNLIVAAAKSLLELVTPHIVLTRYRSLPWCSTCLRQMS